MESRISMGRRAVEYIKNVDPKMYARHAFPLPRLGKVSSNPVEQANSGLLPIREFAPFKLLVELWSYMQLRFNERRREAQAREELLTVPAHRSHAANVRTFGQWSIAEDGFTRALVKTADDRHAYIVDVSEKARCTCYELQEMIWPCQHIMAWDDRQGKDYMRHFHSCWLTSSLVSMYEGKMPVFLCNDLQPTDDCFPPEAAVRKGRHRVVRMQAGHGSRGNRFLSEDEFEDAFGNLYLQYPVTDDPQLAEPIPTLQILQRASAEQPTEVPSRTTRRRNPQQEGRRGKCSKCGRPGHNRRTCDVGRGQTSAAEEPVGNDHGGGEDGIVTLPFSGDMSDAVPLSPWSLPGVPIYPLSDPDSESDIDITSATNSEGLQSGDPVDVPQLMSTEEIDYYVSLVPQSIGSTAGGYHL